MPVFGTLHQLDTYVKKVTIGRQIVPLVKNISEEKLNDRIESEIYDEIVNGGDDSFYQNTYGLRNSATSTEEQYGNGIYNDGISIETKPKPKSNYVSYYGGKSVKDKIVGWLNNGHAGFYKSKAVSVKGKKFIEKAQQDLVTGSELKKRVSNSLKLKGYIITRNSK